MTDVTVNKEKLMRSLSKISGMVPGTHWIMDAPQYGKIQWVFARGECDNEILAEIDYVETEL